MNRLETNIPVALPPKPENQFGEKQHKHVFVLGLGYSIVQSVIINLNRAGAHVFLTDYHQHNLNTIMQQLSYPANASGVVSSSLQPQAIEQVMQLAFRKFGPIDCAINNITLPETTTNVIDCTPDYYEQEFKELFLNSFILHKYEIALLLGSNKGGQIVNIFHTHRNKMPKDAHGLIALLHAVRGLNRSLCRSYAKEKILAQSYIAFNSSDTAKANISLGRPRVLQIDYGKDLGPVNNLSDEILSLLNFDQLSKL